MKIMITSMGILLVLVCLNYPIFDSEKISYLIILSCLIILCFLVARLYFPSDKDDYNSVEKKMDALHSYDGIFQYMENGFYVKQKDITEFIKWDEIVSVYSFSIPVLQERQTGMEIITDNKEYEFDDRNTPGIEKLTDELSSRMPD